MWCKSVKWWSGCRRRFRLLPSIDGAAIEMPKASQPVASEKRRGVSGTHGDHPADAKPVGEHAKFRRPEGFARRHDDFAALGERGEDAVSFGSIRQGERQRKA